MEIIEQITTLLNRAGGGPAARVMRKMAEVPASGMIRRRGHAGGDALPA